MADILIEHQHRIALDPDTKSFFTDLIKPVITALAHLEQRMTDISDFLDAQSATLDQISAALTDVTADVEALLAKAGTSGVFTTEEQATADAVASKLAAVSAALGNLDIEVGDQDASDNPV